MYHVSQLGDTAYLPLADACPMDHEDQTEIDLVIIA